MSKIRRGIACGALSAVCGAALAQGASKAEVAAEAAAAMERAQRQAANPMRRILEASKARPKPAAEAAPIVAATAAVAAVAPRADAGFTTPTIAPAPAPAPAPVPAPVATPAVSTLSADLLQRPSPGVAVPALETASTSAQPMAALAPLAMPAAPVVVVRPQLVNMVEPVIPARVLDDLGRIGEVSVDLTIRADGSVAAVALVPPAPRQIQRYVIAALEQWRYEPLPAERVHRVQLVFNSGDR